MTGADAEAGAGATAPRRVGGRHARGDGGRGALARGVLALAHVFILLHLEHSNGGHMSKTTTMTVRISGALSEFVAASVGENGAYENISEYVRDLIRRDKERTEREAFDRLKAELTRAFAGRVWLVSKAGPRIQARTRSWLTARDFFRRTGVAKENLRFCRERPQKAEHARELVLTHFIDDRLDVLRALQSV